MTSYVILVADGYTSATDLTGFPTWTSRRTILARMATTASTSHQQHNVHSFEVDTMDTLSPNRSSAQPRRPLDTLQALRRPPIDPIVLAASLSTGPHVTRHHFLHSFGPKTESKQMPRSERQRRQQQEEKEEAKRRQEKDSAPISPTSPNARRRRAGSYANCDADTLAAQLLDDGESASTSSYSSFQAPRSQRLQKEKEAQEAIRKTRDERREAQRQRLAKKEEHESKARHDNSTQQSQSQRPGLVSLPSAKLDEELHQRKTLIEKEKSLTREAVVSRAASRSGVAEIPSTASMSSIVRPPPLHVRCYARTRIPTPHGEIFCHLYRNNRDHKEHLALVIDPEQNRPDVDWESMDDRTHGHIRSHTLDEVWGPTETEMERIVRGAYVGRLSPTVQKASHPSAQLGAPKQSSDTTEPLVRIHSECYTGETIGSQRCDCGEQLDEAIRLIHSDAQPAKGVVVYLRQEGRGIGLLDKLMAYNLQDMGHDTVSANILLGHLADARKYDIAAEILRDLGVSQCRLLTNNPEKMDALEAEGVRVTQRVPMVPRIWRAHEHPKRRSRKIKSRSKKSLEASVVSQFEEIGSHEGGADDSDASDSSRDSYLEHFQRRSGATLVGASVTRGPELEKYLRTKVERMGHLLDVPAADVTAAHKQQPNIKVESESDETGYNTHTPATDDQQHMNHTDLYRYAQEASEQVLSDDDEGEDILIQAKA